MGSDRMDSGRSFRQVRRSEPILTLIVFSLSSQDGFRPLKLTGRPE